jgi:hypothetical protein
VDPTIWSALIAASCVLAGMFATRGIEVWKAKYQQSTEAEATYREQLRVACSTHASNLTAYVQAALEEGRAHAAIIAPPSMYVPSPDLGKLRQAARVSNEQVRLLSNSLEVQRKARLAMRHAYAVMLTAGGLPDPRASEYPQGSRPYKRFELAFHEFLVESRRELGLANPDDVFAEP